MAITKFIKTCALKKPGNDPQLYLLELAKITSVTEVADEITTVTLAGGDKFQRWQADFDSVQFTSEGTYGTSGGETQNIIFRLSGGTRKAIEAAAEQLKAAAACGLVAIVVDGNRTPFMVGINAVTKEGKSRPIKQVTLAYDSGTMPTDEDVQGYTITLIKMGHNAPAMFNAALTTNILDGDAGFIDYT